MRTSGGRRPERPLLEGPCSQGEEVNHSLKVKKSPGFLELRAFAYLVASLFLACFVALVELVHAAGGIDDLHLAGVERVRSVGNLKLHKRIFDTLDGYRLLGGGATAG